jgi:aspartate/methionine/tyrosine aminotransferase
MYQTKRDVMLEILCRTGFEVCKPLGSYFIMADWREVAPTHVQDDTQFARWLIEEIGVACIPPSFFYRESDKHMGRYLARFAVCKKDETLAAAADRLSRLASR